MPASQAPARFEPGPEAARRAREALAAGQLVLLPTETVYGIAARADDPAALERLRACKGRDAANPFSVHLGLSEGERPSSRLPASSLPHTAARLVDAFWPGPLTLVVETPAPALAGIARDGLVGLRAPYQAFTTALLAELAFPIVMSSANLSGAPPTVSVDEALASLGDHAGALALAVDAGPTATAQSHLASSVLVLAPGRFELAREGLLELGELRRAAGLRLGFVCTGNTCRSPLAEAFAQLELETALDAAPATFGFQAMSMGLAAGPGAPASPHSLAIAAEAGWPLDAHRAHQATLEDLLGLDRVYTMTSAHRDHIVDALGAHPELPPVETLHPTGRSIADPFGGDRGDYDVAAADIRDAIRLRVSEWV